MKLLNGFINLLYPNVCGGCNAVIENPNTIICASCFASFPKSFEFEDKKNKIAQLFWGKTPLEHAFTTFKYVKESSLQNLIYDLKYRGNTEVGRVLGVEIGKQIKESNLKIDVVIPVPLHPKKQKTRGYNQSWFIAQGVTRRIILSVKRLLLVENKIYRNANSKTKLERHDNVENKFAVAHSENLEGKHILLVDDVITTGATMVECCALLKKIKNVKVSVAAIASG